MGSLHIHILLQKQLPQALELATLKGEFKIITAPIIKQNGISFKAKVLSLACEAPSKRWPPQKLVFQQVCSELYHWRNAISLTAYHVKQPDHSSQALLFKVGDTINAKVRLRRPRGMVNRGLFDYQAWLLAQGIYAKGYILPNTLSISRQSSYSFETLRAAIGQKINTVEGITLKPLFMALLLGDKSYITSSQWQVLQQTGTLHLMAISGLHIGLSAWLGFVFSRWCVKWLVRCVWRIFGRFYWCRFYRLLPYGVSIVTAFLYAGLAGFSVPTLRALIMVCTVNICFILSRRVSFYRVLFLAALVIVLLDPFVFLATGFWLSFGAVFVLLFVYTPRSVDSYKTGWIGGLIQVKHYWMMLVRMQWVLFLALLFPVLFFTDSVSWVAPLANIFMVPLVSFVIVPSLFLIALLFFVMPSFAGGLLNITNALLHFFWWLLEWLSKLQMTIHEWAVSYVILGALPLWGVILGCICTVCFFVFKPMGVRLLSLGLMLLLVMPRYINKPYFSLSVLDVGQGLAVVVNYEDFTLVYDTGAYFSPSFDMGKNIIVPSLIHNNIKHIDSLVISHSDNDHKGGAESLMNTLNVKHLMVSQADSTLTLKGLTHKDIQTDYCARDVPFYPLTKRNMDAATLNIKTLWPIEDQQYKELLASTNNRSCVLLIQAADVSILLTGDIDHKVEQVLIEKGIPKVDILIAPHHGSRTSSSAAFVHALSPSAVIFSSGYKNKYGHPHSHVVNIYTQKNIKTFNTASDGEVYLLYDINKPYHVGQIKTARQEKPRLPWAPLLNIK